MKTKFGKIALLFALFIIFSGSLFAQSRHENRKTSLAVLNFISGDGLSRQTADFFSSLIESRMVNTRLFRIVARQNINEILKDQAFQQSGCNDEKCAVQIGKLLAAEKIMTGVMTKIGKKIYINVRIIDVETGKIDFSENAVSPDSDSLQEAAKKLSRKIAARIAGVDEDAVIVRKRISWKRTVWRSMLLPGWGQYYSGYRFKGIFLFSVTGLLGTLYYYKNRDFQQSRRDYEASLPVVYLVRQLGYGGKQIVAFTGINQLLPLKEQYLKDEKQVNIIAAIFWVMYAYNILDIVRNSDRETEKARTGLRINVFSRSDNAFYVTGNDHKTHNTAYYITVKYKF